MPVWRENMTDADHARNIADMQQQVKADAARLRSQADAMIAEADRLDPQSGGEPS